MAEPGKASKAEAVKENSRQLRGTIADELTTDEAKFSGDNASLLKFHGSYQQDDRDRRGKGGKEYMFMLRTKVPGGKLTAEQVLAELDLCERYGNGTLRITDRQGFQIHGILKGDLQETIRGVHETKLTTLGACGDVNRNVMCCPAPYVDSPVRAEMQAMAAALSDHFAPSTTAYYEIWLRNGEDREKVHEQQPAEDPIYGKAYLPRKFKMAITLPEDNCVDVYANDFGLIAVVEAGSIAGYNVLVGGGMGMTPAKKQTFPAIGRRMAYVPAEDVIAVAEAVVKVQRDFGRRDDRSQARLKYLIADWGLERFKAKVEEYLGRSLAEPRPVDVTGVDDHLGWHEQGDGKLFLGLNVDNGRIKDEGDFRLKSALRAILGKYGMDCRNTALQGLILCDIEPGERGAIEQTLREHGVALAEEISLTRRYAMACPAFPTCGLAITESERVMPDVLAGIEAELARHGLGGERFCIHMTGCPNGCARPYTPDIGLVGKSRGKYTIYLGGNAEGTRLAFVYADQVPQEEIVPRLAPVFAGFKSERTDGESFGDFCHRRGEGGLAEFSVEE
ncbi:MAG: NADPH-dependent assimilatory sulfite reductase hemoprotein subunit [Planctomycetota bacterium]|nr:MAG: NADPH-dependent assimilatory sulfite reductase hemoprotein subunit [Planctomycetota bacterium]REJ86027.1 MAG: NADPH-dependent assimilatory sulfite reductase hemoprotein subunit [Planctomycetota bacterium]REK20030.1 MAG: NADPH-dependent assimilatory sulfite reductase hemoprotein subunit [Planctomycetota bacterium]REK29307.1 MAG: NADPH-dependent assimilatory sulfite reductase hemoprotein subunit [Planctomycetota bacterium]